MEPLITDKDGTTYTIEEWQNAHRSGVYESSIGGQTRYGAACSCGFRTSPYARDKTAPEAQLTEHLQTTWLSAEMAHQDKEP